MDRETWRTSSYSGASGECVEISQAPHTTRVRDTRHREHDHLVFPTREWFAFLHGVKEDEVC